MNAHIENFMKQQATFLGYQKRQPHEKTIPYDTPCKPSDVVGADIFSINKKTLLFIVNYYSKFSITKKADGLSADNLIRTAKMLFVETGLPKKIVSDAGTNFIFN